MVPLRSSLPPYVGVHPHLDRGIPPPSRRQEMAKVDHIHRYRHHLAGLYGVSRHHGDPVSPAVVLLGADQGDGRGLLHKPRGSAQRCYRPR